VVATVAAMMFIGSSSALAEATDLCEGDPKNGSCPTGKSLALAGGVHFVDQLALLFFSVLGVKKDILCSALFASYLEVEIEIGKKIKVSGGVLDLAAAGAGGQVIHGGFTYGEPHGKGLSCSEMEGKEKCGKFEEFGLPGSLLKVLRTGEELGTVTSEGAEVLVECSGLHCIFSMNGVIGTFSGSLAGGNGRIASSGVTVNKVSGLLCPPTASLTMALESLIPVYIGH
jgi:hypothetical protein